jgi:hypothetical protein
LVGGKRGGRVTPAPPPHHYEGRLLRARDGRLVGCGGCKTCVAYPVGDGPFYCCTFAVTGDLSDELAALLAPDPP